MITKIRRNWAEWTEREKWLLGLLILSLGGGAWVFWAWMQDLKPWAREYGTVADWFIFAATAAGFAVAVSTLRRSARDARDRAAAEDDSKRESQRADAARVAVKWTVEESVYEGFSKDVVFTVGNSGSGPVTHAYLRLDYQTLPTWCSATPHDHIDGIFPNSSVEVRFPAYTEKFSFITEYAKGFADVIELGFRDVHGQDWRRKGKVLERVSPEEASIHNQWQLLKAPAGSN